MKTILLLHIIILRFLAHTMVRVIEYKTNLNIFCLVSGREKEFIFTIIISLIYQWNAVGLMFLLVSVFVHIIENDQNVIEDDATKQMVAVGHLNL
jgi:hypothetical protein